MRQRPECAGCDLPNSKAVAQALTDETLVLALANSYGPVEPVLAKPCLGAGVGIVQETLLFYDQPRPEYELARSRVTGDLVELSHDRSIHRSQLRLDLRKRLRLLGLGAS